MRKSGFPSRLYRWFLTQQAVIGGIFFLALAVGFTAYLEGGGFTRETILVAKQSVLAALTIGFLVFIAVTLYTGRRVILPLGRMIDKTRRMREYPFEGEEIEHDEVIFDEPGEWFEFEQALNRLGRELRQKTIRLSREKTELRTIMSA